MTTYAIIGSTTFPLAEGAGYILRKMTELKKGDDVIVRGSNHVDEPRVPLMGVDSIVAVFAETLGLPVHVVPLPRVANGSWERASITAKTADVVWAFFDPDKVMSSGTAIVANLALSYGKSVKAWTVDHGELEEVGDS